MNISNNNFNDYLHSAKRLYRQEHSYPTVYRELIKDLEPDEAIQILNELQKLTISKETELVIH